MTWLRIKAGWMLFRLSEKILPNGYLISDRSILKTTIIEIAKENDHGPENGAPAANF